MPNQMFLLFIATLLFGLFSVFVNLKTMHEPMPKALSIFTMYLSFVAMMIEIGYSLAILYR